MSIAVNHEEVSRTLALKVADLEYQVAAYKSVVAQYEQRVAHLESQIPTNTEVKTNDPQV